MDIEANLRAYLGQRTPTARYTSFDYCYNHFQRHRERGALQLVVGPSPAVSGRPTGDAWEAPVTVPRTVSESAKPATRSCVRRALPPRPASGR